MQIRYSLANIKAASQDLCWKVYDHAQSFVLRLYTTEALLLVSNHSLCSLELDKTSEDKKGLW